MRKIFITGTDTNIGKTYVTVKLLQKFNRVGLKTIGLKPLATGSVNGLNADALSLIDSSSVKLNYTLINPFSFSLAASPNIASSNLSAEAIYNKLQIALEKKIDIALIEGIGGWLCPINNNETMADVIKKIIDVEIILVVGIRLGCLNHALLTYKTIKDSGLNIIGWIANIIDPDMQAYSENIATLKKMIIEPCLEVFEYEYNR